MARKPPSDAQRQLVELLGQVQGPRLYVRWARNYGYVAAGLLFGRWGRTPVCRFEYIGGDKQWRCAIYKPSRNAYGGDGFVFPADGDPVKHTEMCLNALGLA